MLQPVALLHHTGWPLSVLAEFQVSTRLGTASQLIHLDLDTWIVPGILLLLLLSTCNHTHLAELVN